MDETERMVALKKAYAEMILNTSKEAAARVMAAERKAYKFERDLLSTKEEALRMLLRLKQMIDAKNSEAEITSLNQKKRIEVLEAQLDEAEGLIIDLRAKLSKVQERLDDVNCEHISLMRPNGKVDMPCTWMPENEQGYLAPLKSFPELGPKFVTSDTHTSPSESSVLVHECLMSAKGTSVPNSEFNHCPVYAPVFASSIPKSTDPELYRNGCSQRICAIETGLADEKQHPTDEIASLLRSLPTLKKKVEDIGNDTMPSSRSERLNIMENSTKEAAFPKDNTTRGPPVKVARRLRRRKTRYSKGKTALCRNLSGKSMKLVRTSAISRCKNHSFKSKVSSDTSTSIENVNEVNASGLGESVPLENFQTVSVVRRSLRKRKIKHWDEFATSSRQHDTCTNSSKHEDHCWNNGMMGTVAKSAKLDAKASENVLGLENGGEFEKGIQSKTAFATHGTCLKAEEGITFVGDVAEKDFKLTDNSMLVQPSQITPETKSENLLLVPLDLGDSKTFKATNRVPIQPDRNKPLKYTFSRKRKKGFSVNSNGNNCFGEISVKKWSGEENRSQSALENSNLADESSSYGSGLVQVARQLISLSSKRWW